MRRNFLMPSSSAHRGRRDPLLVAIDALRTINREAHRTLLAKTENTLAVLCEKKFGCHTGPHWPGVRGFVERNVAVGTTVVSDGFAGYRSTHVGGVVGNMAARLAALDPSGVFQPEALVRRHAARRVRKQHLRRYLDEFTFRLEPQAPRLNGLRQASRPDHPPSPPTSSTGSWPSGRLLTSLGAYRT